MEVSGVVFRQIPCFSGIGAGIDTHSSSNPCVCAMSVRSSGGKLYGAMNCGGGGGFRDKGHLQYYYGGGGPRCGNKKEKETTKKKLKLLKGLSKDLSVFSDLGFGDGLIGQVQGKMVSEAAETLLKQLQQLRAEEKELKKKRKEDKAKLKATRMKTMLDCESSSSESSDSECGEVIDMTRLRNEPTAHPILSELQPVSPEATTILMTQQVRENVFEDRSVQNTEQECCTGPSTSCSNVSSISRNDESSSSSGASTKRIEVCMGNKCNKSGGAALLEEFERVLGVEGAVVGCKCMGKCRDGPNVRVLNSVDGIQTHGLDDSVRTPPNPLCIGVGLEDVGVIVANFLGDDRKDLGLTPASFLK